MTTQQNFSRYDRGYLPINFNLKQVRERQKLTQITLSVNVNGKRLRVYSHIRVEPEYWNPEMKRCYDNELLCPRVRKRVRTINTRLDKIVHQIEQQDHLLAEKGRYLKIEDIRKAVLCVTASCPRKETADTISVMKQIAGSYHSRLNRRGMMGQATTSTTYLMAVGRLENFLKHRGRSNLSFGEMDKSFFAEFSDYLTRYSFNRGSEIKHYTAMTVANTLGAIRNILHRAYDLELCDNTYYNMIETSVPHGSSDKVYLTEKEIAKIANVEVRNPMERNVRDMFVIASYTALRISDINMLNNALIDKGQIITYQTKTKSQVHIPILKEISDLIGSYRDAGFPTVRTGNANACIKELANRAGIRDTILISEIRGGVKRFIQVPKYSQVSFHTARRSCITNLFKRGYSANYIMTMSGHKSIASFQRYVKSSTDELSQEFVCQLRKHKAIE